MTTNHEVFVQLVETLLPRALDPIQSDEPTVEALDTVLDRLSAASMYVRHVREQRALEAGQANTNERAVA